MTSLRLPLVVLAAAALAGCSKRPPEIDMPGGGHGGGGGGSMGGAGNGGGGNMGGGGSGVMPPIPDAGPPTPTKSCGELPKLRNVRASVRADNVSVTFEPVGGAKDYRIYPLGPDGKALANPIYRCAGGRGGPPIPLDRAEHSFEMGAFDTFVNRDVNGYKRTTAEATLGYVYMTAGEGRLPVYAMGDPAPNADNACLPVRYDETQVKKYVTSESERNMLLEKGWRDHGLVFYLPAPGTAGNVTVFTASDPVFVVGRYYMASDAEKSARSKLNPTPAFEILSAPGPDTEPLMRVYYKSACSQAHDELVAGQGRFEFATTQGNRPVTTLQWSGLTGATTLAIEALDVRCPYQGFLSPTAVAGWTSPEKVVHQPFVTIDQMRAADPMGEVFINGQNDVPNPPRPRPVACAQVQVNPEPAESDWEFHDDFTTDPGPFMALPDVGFKNKFYKSAKYDLSFIAVDHPSVTFGSMLGEFWVAYADWAADTNGKMRLTPNAKGTLAADKFLHATMEVDVTTSGRRYPQLFISDRPAPLTDGTYANLEKGYAILVQTIGTPYWPGRLDIQFCDHRGWDVNFQCPHFATDWNIDLSNMKKPVNPVPLIGELSGVDRRIRWDVYASTQRVYAFMDGKPMACGQLPAGKAAAGPVTVTFADVLYHSGVDVPDPPYTWHNKRMHTETRRHFDEIAFKSGVAAPAWNETLFPCTSATMP